MVPILLSGATVRGFLSEALTCDVTEERNGIFELELTYPVSGLMFPELCVDKLIKVKPNDTADCQLFRIYQISKPLNGIVTVSAEHISYALSHYPVSNISMTGITATQAINAVLTTAAGSLSSPHGFSVGTTDMTALRDFSVQVCSARAALGGVSGSVLDVFGGEYEFDNYIVRLHTHRGSDTGVIVSYGKNLTDVNLTTSTENSYTALFPYCLKDDVLTVLSERRIDVTNTSGISQRLLLMDFTSLFETDEEISETALRNKATAWLAENDINSPTINMTVSFVHLWQSPEYASFAALEKVSLCDYVTVRHTVLGIDVKAQVIKTVYDTLGERYQKIELGSAKANFADTLKQTTKHLEDAVNALNVNSSAITEAYLQAIDDATNAITGNSGGYVVLNPPLNPQELLVMNSADINTATKVWRWNVSGLGYSSNGYAGPFSTAITMNGAIVADFIKTGTLTANIINAGVLSSADGLSYFNLESGVIHTANAEIVGGSVEIGDADFKTRIVDGHIKQYKGGTETLIGGLVPAIRAAVGGGTERAELLYYDVDDGISGVVIAGQENGSFTPIAQFSTDKIKLIKPIDSIPINCSGSPKIVMQYYNGAVALGADTMPLNVYATKFQPAASGAIDLGSGSNKWRNLNLSGAVNCNGVNTNGYISCNSFISAGSNEILCGDITCLNIISKGHKIGDIGASSSAFKNIYTDDIIVNGHSLKSAMGW
jgi:phage minor structural protein